MKSSCGDIDMLMTFKDGKKHTHDIVLARLVDKLKEIGKEILRGVQHRTGWKEDIVRCSVDAICVFRQVQMEFFP